MSEVPFREMEYDGILGMGMLQLAIGERYSFIEQIKKDSLFNSFYIDKSQRALVIEQEDEEFEEGFKVPIIKDNGGHWAIEVQDIIINGVSYLLGNLIGIVDTGSSFMTMPERVYQEVIKAKFKDLNYCQGEKMPTIVIKIEGRYYQIKPDHYINNNFETIKENDSWQQ